MDERVLKWITGLLAVLTVVVCISLYFFPDVHAKAVLAAENEIQEVYGTNAEFVTATNPEDVVEQDDGMDAQLQVGLPENLVAEQIQVDNEYITQTVYIRFANGVSDYFGQYNIRGSSDHIASLSYYKDGSDGVIALTLDRVYEIKQNYDSGKLYLDFMDPHELYDKVVVVDAGHGSRAPGAVKQGVAEKNIDLAILLELKKIFDEEDGNIGVYYTRVADTNPTLDQRVQLANKANADLFISIHNNSSASGNFTRTNGTQVMFSESDTSEFSSRRFAQICLDNVVEALGSTKRSMLRGDSIYIIRTSEVPVALIEVGFMTNYEELDKLKNPEYQAKAAQGIYNAIMEAFEEGY